jgi:hypothetical protein
MRRTGLLLVVMGAVAGVCLAGDNPVVGTWEAVSVVWTQPDGTASDQLTSNNTIKIYSATHFAVVSQNQDGTFSHAFAGEYLLKGNSLTEKVQLGSSAGMIGSEVTHKFSISGDDWESTWVAPNEAKVKEVWKRVK